MIWDCYFLSLERGLLQRQLKSSVVGWCPWTLKRVSSMEMFEGCRDNLRSQTMGSSFCPMGLSYGPNQQCVFTPKGSFLKLSSTFFGYLLETSAQISEFSQKYTRLVSKTHHYAVLFKKSFQNQRACRSNKYPKSNVAVCVCVCVCVCS